MIYNLQNKKVNYIINEKFYELKDNKPTLIFLHGWGGNIKNFTASFNYFANFYPVLAVDFWGFGESDAPNDNYILDDYINEIDGLINYLKIDNSILIGHSFGGRVAIKLAIKNKKIKKLILVDSAGVKPKFSLMKYFKVKHYKLKKFLVKHNFLSSNCLTNCGSIDYKLMKENEKGVFIRIINEHLDECLPKIAIPTLIIWGENDKETPLYMAKTLNKKIAHSKLSIIKGGHYAYIENNVEFCNLINNFIGE